MNEFLTTVLTFPTLPFSILLTCCVIYWLIASLGLVDFHLHDPGAADFGHGDFGHHHHHHGEGAQAATGLLARLGLNGVPFMLMLSILSFWGWFISYFLQLFLLPHLPSFVGWLVGAVALVVSLVIALVVTAIVLKPVRWAIASLSKGNRPVVLIGRSGVVLSQEVTPSGGRAEFADGGAGLILQVRAPQGHSYPRGTAVIITAHDTQHHTYEVVSQSDFNNS